MAVDLSVFGKQKTLIDQNQLQKEFEIKKQAAITALQRAKTGADLPAALQLANEYQTRLDAGDTEGANILAQFAKTTDKGLAVAPDGSYMALPGYGGAVGEIAGTKKSYETQAQKNVELGMNPRIERATQDQTNQSNLNYAPQITGATKSAESNVNQITDLQKKATSAANTASLTDQARTILQTGKPTGSYAGAGLALGKRIVGRSDENTQANAALDVIAGNITGNIPRMEGPQSDADRAYYQSMAGRVNDKTLPIGDRLSALDEIDKVNAKYATINSPGKSALGQNINQDAPIMDTGQWTVRRK